MKKGLSEKGFDLKKVTDCEELGNIACMQIASLSKFTTPIFTAVTKQEKKKTERKKWQKLHRSPGVFCLDW